MGERFRTYTLSGLLPDGASLTVDVHSHIATLLRDERIVEQCTFTNREFALLVVLLASHPYYAPQEQLLSAHTGQSVEEARHDIQQAYNDGDADMALHDVRNVLSRMRLKMRSLGLEATAILETGYMLVASKQTAQHHVESSKNGRACDE